MATCIAYATARPLPGGTAIRERLYEHVADVLRKMLVTDATDRPDDLQALYGLMVLYNYTDIQSGTTRPEDKSGAGTQPALTFWSLKSLVEGYAFRIHCHQAVRDVSEALKVGKSPPDSAMRKYICLLWLFIMSHQCVLPGYHNFPYTFR